MTPLYYAVLNDNTEIVELLLVSGAIVNKVQLCKPAVQHHTLSHIPRFMHGTSGVSRVEQMVGP